MSVDLQDWLTPSTAIDVASSSVSIVLARLAIALGLGCVVAATYAWTRRHGGADLLRFCTTIVLLAVLVAMTTLVIGDNVARAFGLVGALSIVRFRTVVDDTRDTVFVIFAVVTGMAVGAGYVAVYLIGVPLTAVAALALARLPARRGSAAVNGVSAGPGLADAAAEQRLHVRVAAGIDPQIAVESVVRPFVVSLRPTRIETARQGAAVDVRYAITRKPTEPPFALVAALQRVEGVLHVELE